jgi:hypothetical protein
METIDIIAKFAPVWGPASVVVFLWYMSDRANQKALTAYREDTLRQSAEHEKALAEVRQMYISNVELVKNYQKIAEGLQSLIVVSTQAITRLCDKTDNIANCLKK